MARKDEQTIDLFSIPEQRHPDPGSANYSFEVSNRVSEMLKMHPDDRWQIAAEMSRLSGDDVSKNMLDAWASPGRPDHNIPLYRVALLEQVCHSHLLTDWLVNKRGGQASWGADVLNARLGRLMTSKRKMDAQIKELQSVLKNQGLDDGND